MSLNVKRAQIVTDHHVFILDQTSACRFAAPAHSTLIRIKGKNPTGVNEFFPLSHPDCYSAIHEFEFDDVDFSRIEDHNTVFDSVMAALIVDIFEQHTENKRHFPEAFLVVHCQAGISRSSAVACGFALFSQNKKLEEDIRSGWFTPNARVYRCIFEEIDRRESKIRVGDLRRATQDLPDHAIVNIMFETGYAQFEQNATSIVPIKDGITGQRLIITHELDLLPMAESRMKDYSHKEYIGFCVLKGNHIYPGVNEPETLIRYKEKIRKDWSERYGFPMPKDCPSCDHTLLPEYADRHEMGFTFYKWRCTRRKCEQNKRDGEVTKVPLVTLSETT